MNTIVQCFEYGGDRFDYEIVFGDRKSLEIAVHPDKSIVVKAPLGTDLDEVARRMNKRARWIRKQVQYFQQFDPRTPERSYVSGETHLYLGKRYRLHILDGAQEGVKLSRGRLAVVLNSKAPSATRKLVGDWYRQKAQERYSELFEACWSRFKKHGHQKPVLQIRKMSSRWGSLSKAGTLTLNADLIRAPKECIEYVILHELCHLAHHDHSKQFYDLLEVCLPDWEKRKHKLELALI